MGSASTTDPSEVGWGDGDDGELAALMERHRDRLHTMVAIRMDRRLRGRMDASDVVQEGYVEAIERYSEYVRNPTMPPFLWLRFIVGQRLRIVHRQHLGV